MKLTKKLWPTLCLLWIVVGCQPSTHKPTQSILLEVGSQQWTAQQFSARWMQAAKALSDLELSDGKTLQALKQKTIKQMIVESLLIRWDRQTPQPISMDVVQAQKNATQAAYINQKSFLTENHLSPESWDAATSQIHARLAKEKLLKTLKPEIAVDANLLEIQKKYWADKGAFVEPAKIQLQQIVVKSQTEAVRLYQALKKGASFDDLAKKYSIGLEAKDQGHLGWIKKGSFDPFDQAFSLPILRISKPVPSPYGFHIFRVLAKKRKSKLPLETVKARFRKKALGFAKRKLYKDWLEQQLSTTTIRKNEDALKAAIIDVSGGTL